MPLKLAFLPKNDIRTFHFDIYHPKLTFVQRRVTSLMGLLFAVIGIIFILTTDEEFENGFTVILKSLGFSFFIGGLALFVSTIVKKRLVEGKLHVNTQQLIIELNDGKYTLPTELLSRITFCDGVKLNYFDSLAKVWRKDYHDVYSQYFWIETTDKRAFFIESAIHLPKYAFVDGVELGTTLTQLLENIVGPEEMHYNKHHIAALRKKYAMNRELFIS